MVWNQTIETSLVYRFFVDNGPGEDHGVYLMFVTSPAANRGALAAKRAWTSGKPQS